MPFIVCRALGHDTIEVLWVGPMVPYARLGGQVGRLFFVYRRRIVVGGETTVDLEVVPE